MGELREYRRTIWQLIKSLLIAPLVTFAVGMLFLWVLQFYNPTWFFVLGVIVIAAIFFGLLYSAIFGENLRFELSDDGTFSYYKGRKLKKSYDLTTSDLGYHQVKSANGATRRLSLRITDKEGRPDIVECEPIGSKQFDEMFKEMQKYSKVEPERL
ncbi:MAG: hypothetical protein FWD65_02350 [Coriobacteriia bacterium]|nr:hypothetical protein [Coriobacteriia bacterium]